MTTWDPTYETDEGWTVHRYQLLTGNILRFQAQDIRREHTGVHAKVAISMNWVSLAWSNFNIERDEDRVRLANSAFGHLDPKAESLDIAEFPKNLFKHALDLFCIGLWDESVGSLVGGQMCGDPSIAPARPLVGMYVLKDAGSILFAPPGAGKTYTAMGMAVSCAWGVDKVWRLSDSWLPLYVNVERSGVSMAARLAQVNAAFGLEAETSIPFLNARGKSLSDIYEATKRTLVKESCQWVIYDSMSRAGFGSMVGDDVANKIMDMLNALCPTWLALAHSPRADETHAFGSQMFDAAADLTVQLRAQTSSDRLSTGVSLEVIKANDIAKPPMSVHVLEWGEQGLENIRRGRADEFAELAEGERKTNEQRIAEYLDHAGAASGSKIAEDTGMNRSLVARILSTSRSFRLIRREGKDALYGHVLPSNTL